MESLQSLEDMRLEFERLEAEESEIDRELGELIKQQPNLLIKGKILFLKSYSHLKSPKLVFCCRGLSGVKLVAFNPLWDI